MKHYFFKRVLHIVPVLIMTTLCAFFLGVITPGDPAYIALTRDSVTEPTDEEVAEKRHALGLDLPYHEQYFKWIKKAVVLDFGESIYTGEDISTEIKRRLPVTLRLSLYAVVMTTICGILCGCIMALFKDSYIDVVMRFFATLMSSIPSFWMAIILVTFFSENLGILPTSGIESSKSYILPTFVLSLSTIGFVSRLTRSSFLGVLSKDYLMLANAKGLKRHTIGLIHIFKNGIIPVITFLGLYFASILGGASIVETIFSIPGIGKYAIESIYAKDYYVIQAYVMITGSAYVFITILVDLFCFVINPKLRGGDI